MFGQKSFAWLSTGLVVAGAVFAVASASPDIAGAVTKPALKCKSGYVVGNKTVKGKAVKACVKQPTVKKPLACKAGFKLGVKAVKKGGRPVLKNGVPQTVKTCIVDKAKPVKKCKAPTKLVVKSIKVLGVVKPVATCVK